MTTFRFLIITCLALIGCQVKTSHADHPQTAKIASPQTNTQTGPVTTTVIPQFDSVHFGSTPHLNVLVKLQAAEAANKTRPPLDLGVVIDTSGSMSGGKLRDAKRAALELVAALRADDRVTLIAYSSSVRRLTNRLPADAEGKAILKNHVTGLNSSGSTALGPALFDAFGALQQGANDGLRLRHVILMSDGLANVGERRPKVLGQRSAEAFRRGISVSTMGVGLNYNEDLMTHVADQGGGRYHFIKESNQIASILTDELNGLVGTVARNVVMRFNGIDGVNLIKAFGYPFERNGEGASVRIGFMGSKQLREVMLRVAVSPGLAQKVVKAGIKLGAITIDYIDVAADGVARKDSAGLTVQVAGTSEAAQKTENTEVSIRMGEIDAANKLQIAARRAESGDFDGARGSIQRAIDKLSVQNRAMPSPRLRKQIKELKEAKDEVKGAAASMSARKSYTKKYKARAYRKSK